MFKNTSHEASDEGREICTTSHEIKNIQLKNNSIIITITEIDIIVGSIGIFCHTLQIKQFYLFFV